MKLASDPILDNTGASQPRLTAASICAEYGDRIYRFASMIAKGDVEPEDLAHDAILRAIQHAQQYDPTRGTVEAWLWRIVTNQARDSARVTARKLRLWVRLVGGGDHQESVESSVLARLTLSELLSAIRRLPPLDRQLVALRF